MPEPVLSEVRPGAQREARPQMAGTDGARWKEWENTTKKGSNKWQEIKGSGSGVSTTEFHGGYRDGACCRGILAQKSLTQGTSCTQPSSISRVPGQPPLHHPWLSLPQKRHLQSNISAP